MAFGIWHIKRKKLKLNINNNTSQSQSQRGVLSVDKKVTSPMSVKLHHNPCPSMLDLLLLMLITCLEKDSSGKIKVMFLEPPNKYGSLNKPDLLCVGEL